MKKSHAQILAVKITVVTLAQFKAGICPKNQVSLLGQVRDRLGFQDRRSPDILTDEVLATFHPNM